eukprot:gene3853-4211_t
MADSSVLDKFGLSHTTLFPSQGSIAAEKMSDILSALSPQSTETIQTRAALADGFHLWATCCDSTLRDRIILQHKQLFYDCIQALGQVNDDDKNVIKGESYRGAVFIAERLSSGLSTAGMMDTSQKLTSALSPLAYEAAEKILDTKSQFAVVSPMQSQETSATLRTELTTTLLRTIPYSGTVSLPNGVKVIALILSGDGYPSKLKNDAKSALNTLGNVAKASMSHAGGELIAIAKAGHPDVLMSFLSVQELYLNNPQAVHDNLDVFFSQPYMLYSSLFMRVSQKDATCLLPYLKQLIDMLSQQPNMITVTLMTLEGIAAKEPVLVFDHLPTILSSSKGVPNAGVILAKVLGKIAAAGNNASEIALKELVDLLGKDSSAGASVLVEICNVMKLLPQREILQGYLPTIAKYKSASEVAYTSIEDFAAGRSLETLTNRVDELDAKINALNNKVAETCHNMADVIAYVDANMADMKDFLAEVVKKLPAPKRLEVVGTLRKTFILHFECVRTGYEFPIVSYDWSKWLKMGFSLVKAGQAVIDLGIGNPLGILSKGVECVQEIYTAYKTHDDDEFNSYITNPFLTSTEQDMLLNKLRDQNFFEIFAYDSQRGGWYLVNPERDGKKPEGEQGSVTKVWKKEGYGVSETLQTVAKEAASAIVGADVMETALGVVEMTTDIASSLQSKDGDEGKSNSPFHSTKGDGSSKVGDSKTTEKIVGGRAAAMREQFGAVTTTAADARLGDATRQANYYSTVDELQSKLQQLEAKVQTLSTDVEHLRSQQSSCACTIM